MARLHVPAKVRIAAARGPAAMRKFGAANPWGKRMGLQHIYIYNGGLYMLHVIYMLDYNYNIL